MTLRADPRTGTAYDPRDPQPRALCVGVWRALYGSIEVGLYRTHWGWA